MNARNAPVGEEDEQGARERDDAQRDVDIVDVSVTGIASEVSEQHWELRFCSAFGLATITQRAPAVHVVDVHVTSNARDCYPSCEWSTRDLDCAAFCGINGRATNPSDRLQ